MREKIRKQCVITEIKKALNHNGFKATLNEPGGIRTHDLLIRSLSEKLGFIRAEGLSCYKHVINRKWKFCG